MFSLNHIGQQNVLKTVEPNGTRSKVQNINSKRPRDQGKDQGLTRPESARDESENRIGGPRSWIWNRGGRPMLMTLREELKRDIGCYSARENEKTRSRFVRFVILELFHLVHQLA